MAQPIKETPILYGEDVHRLQSLSFEQLSQQIVVIDNQARVVAVKSINQISTLRNWLIGAYIVEYEQHGRDRAQYGEELINRLSKRLKDRRLDATLLKISRKFYLTYPSVKELVEKSATLSHLLTKLQARTIEVEEITSENTPKSATLSHQFCTPPEKLVSLLSFSHIRELLKLDDEMVRYFYETECIKATWSVRELRRQISSNLHIRIGLSSDKMKAMMMANKNADIESCDLQIRDPFSFEFLGLRAKDVVSESDLENALILHLQEFLLELGKGFCFEARQKRIIIDDEYYYADLVFYNRLLHCNVIVELKNDEFRHEYIGQLNAYVNYFAENEMQSGDNPPIGILLCTHKGKKMVEYALGTLDNNLFVSTYQLQLPDRKVLEDFILDECS